MSDAMIPALISGASALAVCIISNLFQSQASKEQHDKTTALIEYRIDELTRKVEKHNNLVERMAILEQNVSTAWHRLDEIKADIEKIK